MLVVRNNNRLGEYLKSLRQDMGISQYKLAGITGLSVSHICRLEKGNRLPSGTMIVALARALGVAEKELLAMAGYIAANQSTGKYESPVNPETGLDPLVLKALAQETPKLQRQIIQVFQSMKQLAQTMPLSDGGTPVR
jgi:transcriptional regulator with XRE-family HTH domain